MPILLADLGLLAQMFWDAFMLVASAIWGATVLHPWAGLVFIGALFWAYQEARRGV